MSSRPALLPRRLRAPRPRVVGAVVAATGLLAGLAVAISPTAAVAVTAAPHAPIGALHTDTRTTATGITVHGWALDRNYPTANAKVYGVVDGLTRASTMTSIADAAATKKYHAGPTPGFLLAVPVPAGKHTVCVAVLNTGTRIASVIGCLATPLGRAVTTAAKAAHSPTGVITTATTTASSVRVTGFTTDQDIRNAKQTVVLYVDGRSAVTGLTTATLAGAPKASGNHASYAMTAKVSSGTHEACVWAVNIGWGSNTFLGCKAVDTRSGKPLAAGSPSTTILPKVLAEAKKHIGQRYVWGAVGPKTFDCSGLMLYSYKKFGFTTPRVSEDQAHAARLIPASHARPGDLVFYHDTQGDVYHVGMYISPGLTVAAIDTAEGVNYQRIWDPTTASYGSFTHL